MKVFEVKIKLYLLKNIDFNDIQSRVGIFIDSTLSKDSKFYKFHKTNQYKNYCFNNPYPLEEDRVYRKGNIYTLTLRTINVDLAKYFNNKIVNEFNDDFKALTSEARIIPKHHINKIYSLTPLIMKTENGYWKGNLSLDDFERRIKENLIKKYNAFNNKKIDENFDLYTFIEMKNKAPIVTKYKKIKLLGDKVSLNISDDKISQELAYMSLGTGIGEANARGYGFVNFKFL